MQLSPNLARFGQLTLDTVPKYVTISLDMPITLKQPDLEKALNRLAQRQGVPSTKHNLAEAILRKAVEDSKSDPEAWRRPPAPVSTGSGTTNQPAPSIREADPSTLQHATPAAAPVVPVQAESDAPREGGGAAGGGA